MAENTCSTCAFYRQHYAFDEYKIFRVYCGHCTHAKIKRKKPDSKACDKYLRGEVDENTFVTKEYLSKALLEYMLQLELLPEIYEIVKNQKNDKTSPILPNRV